MYGESISLGGLIRLLTELVDQHGADSIMERGFRNPHSFRGSYEDLAFEPAGDVPIGEMLACATAALGATFEGYKGGDYTMSAYTDVHLALVGTSGGSQPITDYGWLYMVSTLRGNAARG